MHKSPCNITDVNIIPFKMTFEYHNKLIFNCPINKIIYQ